LRGEAVEDVLRASTAKITVRQIMKETGLSLDEINMWILQGSFE